MWGMMMRKKKQKQEIMLVEPAQEQQGPNRKKTQNIWLRGMVLAMIGALILLVRYMNISEVLLLDEIPVSELYNVELCSRYNYVLYRDLYNAVNDTSLSYEQLYHHIDYENLKLYINDSDLTYEQLYQDSNSDGTQLYISADMKQWALDYLTMNSMSTEEEAEENDMDDKVMRFWLTYLKQDIATVDAVIEDRINTLCNTMENGNGEIFDYWMQDLETGTIVTNTLQTEQGKDFSLTDYAVWFQMTYDASGNVHVNAVQDSDSDTLIRTLYDSARRGLYGEYIQDIDNYLNYRDDDWVVQVQKLAEAYGAPRNCTVIYGIKQSRWEQITRGYLDGTHFWTIYHKYEQESLGIIFCGIAALLFIGGFFYGNPRKEGKQEGRQFYRTAAEVAITGTVIIVFMYSAVVQWAASLYQEHNPDYYLHEVDWWTTEDVLCYAGNLAVMAAVFFLAWYFGCCIGEVRTLGIRGYLHRRMVISRIWKGCKERVKHYYQSLIALDITGDTRKQVIKLLVINGIVLLVLCTMWIAGWFGILVYSVLLYFVIKKYLSDIQKKYSILLQATNEIANGNLEVKIPEHLGLFEPFKPEIYRIEEGFQRAVEEEVKSQRMKTELITNVSHDLKTPLTAIITYINLLKEENVTEEQRSQYLQILEQKSLRLKALIEDLFEVSKANSKNVTLNLVDMDIVNLLRQVEFEQEDRLAEKHLAVRMRLPEEKVMVRLDSQKAYRIYENLFGNIVKYAMEGTRIYVDMEQTDTQVTVRMKNITEQEITVSAEELTERFVRGDTSRNTEGSGLGLAIVRSFTELMGGSFSVTVDGDLFTANTTWPLASLTGDLFPESN